MERRHRGTQGEVRHRRAQRMIKALGTFGYQITRLGWSDTVAPCFGPSSAWFACCQPVSRRRRSPKCCVGTRLCRPERGLAQLKASPNLQCGNDRADDVTVGLPKRPCTKPIAIWGVYESTDARCRRFPWDSEGQFPAPIILRTVVAHGIARRQPRHRRSARLGRSACRDSWPLLWVVRGTTLTKRFQAPPAGPPKRHPTPTPEKPLEIPRRRTILRPNRHAWSVRRQHPSLSPARQRAALHSHGTPRPAPQRPMRRRRG